MEPDYIVASADKIIEFDLDGSLIADPPPPPPPPLSKEKQEFLDAINQFQRRYTGRSLNWGQIFDVLVSLGYRKVDQPTAPPEANGSPHDAARPDDAANEKPS